MHKEINGTIWFYLENIFPRIKFGTINEGFGSCDLKTLTTNVAKCMHVK